MRAQPATTSATLSFIWPPELCGWVNTEVPFRVEQSSVTYSLKIFQL